MVYCFANCIIIIFPQRGHYPISPYSSGKVISFRVWNLIDLNQSWYSYSYLPVICQGENGWLILTRDVRKSWVFGGNFPSSERRYRNLSPHPPYFTLYTALWTCVAWNLCSHLLSVKKREGHFWDAYSELWHLRASESSLELPNFGLPFIWENIFYLCHLVFCFCILFCLIIGFE